MDLGLFLCSEGVVEGKSDLGFSFGGGVAGLLGCVWIDGWMVGWLVVLFMVLLGFGSRVSGWDGMGSAFFMYVVCDSGIWIDLI